MSRARIAWTASTGGGGRSETMRELWMSSVEFMTAALVLAFSCVMGGMFGSFLNVVAYRAARGESVVRGGSRCPACGSAVRWHDNVPVLGWLRLGGRCRDCHSPIPVRYPLVEAVAAALGGVVGAALLGGGRLLPGSRFAAVSVGADALLLDAHWEFLLMRLAHGTLLIVLLAWAICEGDRLTVSPRWFVATLVVLAGLASATGGPTTVPVWPAAAAAALGAGVGGIFRLATPNRWLGQALVLTGAALGWQPLATTAAVMVLIAAARIAWGRAVGGHPAGVPTCRDLLVAACIQVLAWRWLALAWPAG